MVAQDHLGPADAYDAQVAQGQLDFGVPVCVIFWHFYAGTKPLKNLGFGFGGLNGIWSYLPTVLGFYNSKAVISMGLNP